MEKKTKGFKFKETKRGSFKILKKDLDAVEKLFRSKRISWWECNYEVAPSSHWSKSLDNMRAILQGKK